jgi:hypothetical protein
MGATGLDRAPMPEAGGLYAGIAAICRAERQLRALGRLLVRAIVAQSPRFWPCALKLAMEVPAHTPELSNYLSRVFWELRLWVL